MLYFCFTGDGSIDEAEFCEVCQNNGVPAAEAADAYKRFSKVSLPPFNDLITNFVVNPTPVVIVYRKAGWEIDVT